MYRDQMSVSFVRGLLTLSLSSEDHKATMSSGSFILELWRAQHVHVCNMTAMTQVLSNLPPASRLQSLSTLHMAIHLPNPPVWKTPISYTQQEGKD